MPEITDVYPANTTKLQKTFCNEHHRICQNMSL